MKIRNVKMIDCHEWDALVKKTYGRPYCFQQQDGCKDRGTHSFTVPDASEDEEMNDSVPEVVNHEERGVKFAVWLARDPKKKLKGKENQNSWSLDLWWTRNFYPDFQTVANDLHAKGLLEAGDYTIDIDW
jgi:hypothetical protein